MTVTVNKKLLSLTTTIGPPCHNHVDNLRDISEVNHDPIWLTGCIVRREAHVT